MALKKIVLDLETQKSFDEVGGRGKNHLLKISVCGVYFYDTGKYYCYEEHEMGKLASLLQTADQIIGYNIKDFDFAVLQPYLNFNIYEIPYLDVLEEIEKSIGHRVKLESVAQATLGTGKSGTGLQAIVYWRNGQLEELKKYCLDDVKVTKQVYEYGMKNGKVLYSDYFNVKECPITFAEAKERGEVLHQGSLF
ncbi:MAG: ribonuclease H-like domain-containing protein [Candidatus Doudnabacteria bacterium]|nr:ribonuclease H-like domain-containing protein [Candidatus Doudnabacteria bacterium]